MSVMRFRVLFLIFLFAGLPAMPVYAVRLDISAETDVQARSYNKILYLGKSYNDFYISENTKIGVFVSDIELENYPDSRLGLGVSIRSISGLSTDNMAENPPLAQSQESYPSVNAMPYLHEAYIRADRILTEKLSAVVGRQDYSLGQGISLGSDNIGFTGLLLRTENLFWGFGTDMFYFNPSRYDVSFSTSGNHVELSKHERKYHVYGLAINNKTEEGEWQAYHFYQHYGEPSGSVGGNYVSETRSFSGIRYAMRKKHISFDGEAVMQGGTADLSDGGKADFSGYAFMLKGSWEQGIYIFDNVKLRLAYGRSSSASYKNDGSLATDRDSSFYAALGRRYDGFSRSGYGAIAAATLYDMSLSSDTANGMPVGYSGISVVNAGADIPFKGLLFSIDYYKFKASSANAVSKSNIADETDLRIKWPLGSNLSMELLCSYFIPGEKVYGKSAEKTMLSALSVSAKF